MHANVLFGRTLRTLLLIIGCFLLHTVHATEFDGGDGSAGEPYLVETAEHLNEVRNHLDAHFRQMADIDLDVAPYNDGAGWVPIGTTSNPFTGVYDGNGHTVSNLFINRGSTDYQGLFGFLDEGRIEGLTVSNFDVTARDRSAGLAGQIENYSVVSNCAAIGTLTARSRAGALVGAVQDHARIEDSYAHATVTATSERVGVLTGQLWNNSAALRSFALGAVTGTTRTGGLVGNQYYSTVEDSYSGAAVTGTSNVGGLIGALSSGAVLGSYSFGEVEGTLTSVGGLIGDISLSPEVIASYWDTETSLHATSGGEPDAAGRPTSFMVQQSTYVDWDFDTLWAIGHEGDYTYPYFQGQAPAMLPMADVQVPFAGNLAIDGIAVLGETLTGSYTYYPSSDGHPEDAAWFQWWRADGPTGPYVEIADATNLTLLVESGGEHRWYQFEVIVRDTAGVTSHTHSVTLNFMDGMGTLADPFRIEHAYQLNGVRDHLGSAFLQVAGLNLEPYVDWVPIGTQAEPFVGTYHGGSNVILNLNIARLDEEHVGLFGYMDGSSWVRHLTLTDVSVLGSNAVGAIAGFKESTAEVTDCHMTGVVTGTGDYVGGLFGRLNGTLSDSSVDATVVGGNYVGGLVGGNMPYHSSFTVHRSVMRGEVSGSNWVAGIGTIRGRGEDNVNYATIQGHDRVGGLFGRVTDSAVVRAVNYGAVIGTGEMIGGIVANHHYTGSGSSAGISYSYNLGAVTGVGSVGGIVGRAEGQSVSLSYNRGPVTGSGSVGGIAGHSRRVWMGSAGIHICYNAGEVVGTSDTGALLGSRSSSSSTLPSVTRSYYDHQTSGAGDPLGFARSTAEMIQQVTFEEWSFDTDWSIGHAGEYTYPYLQWQGTNDIPYVDLPIPFASDVFVTGTDSVGETLTGHYIYHPNSAGDPEGATTFRWLRADDQAGPFAAIPDATNQTYTLVEGDDNHWYQFEVTVRDVEDNVGAPVSAILEFTLGGGTADDPWLIANAIQLDRLRNYLGSSHNDKHFVLIADIDLGEAPWNEGAGWEPIGFSSTDSFRGKLNGRGHVIRNLTINRPASNYQGLFGYISGGEVVLLGLENADVTGNRYVGTLAGYTASSSLIRYGYAQGAVEGTQDTGGLIGYNTGSSVQWSYAAATVTGGVSNVGGLLGFGAAHESYWDVEVSGQETSGNGTGQTGLSTEEMQDQESYVGWNFYSCWRIEEDEYPTFQDVSAREDPQPLTLEDLVGAGTEEEPYLIGNVQDLNTMRLDLAAHYRLTNDVDMADTVLWDMARGWTPVGATANRFTGSLDGAGHTISNLTIARPGTTYQGLFGYTENARLENLVLSRAYVLGDNYTAGLAAFASNTDMRNIDIEEVYLEGSAYTGGLVGYAQSGCAMEFVRVDGVIHGANDTGGLAGYVSGGTIHACETDVVVSGAMYVGGLIGRVLGGAILNHCRSAGEILGGDRVGGLIGHFTTATMSDCSSHAAVDGTSNVGGLIGYMGATSTSGTRARVYRSFSVGLVEGSSAVGGLVGAVNHAGNNMVFDSYWDTETSEQAESARGIGQDTETMQSEAGYPSFNFNTVWSIDEGNAYPELQDIAAYPQPQTIDLADLDGDGTKGDPYIILTLDHLNAMRQDVTAHYRLGADIDAAATVAWDAGCGWTPVGTSDAGFSGYLDGHGFTIRNLAVNRPITDYQSLFAYTQDAAIYDLDLEQFEIKGDRYTAGLIAHGTGTRVEFVRGSELDIEGGSDTGGLIGYATGGQLHALFCDAAIRGNTRVGGLIGNTAGNITIYHCRTEGLVQGDNQVGGMAGRLITALMVDCFSHAGVEGGSNAGGLIGYMGGSASASRARVFRSFSTGPVSGSSAVGGLVGGVNVAGHNIEADSYWDMDASGVTNSVRGTGKSTEEMRQQATFAWYNFNSLWQIEEEVTYPEFHDLEAYARPVEITLDMLDGIGTPGDPYIITTLDELNAMRLGLTNYFRLAADIDASSVVVWDAGQGWTPVGDSDGDNMFTGTLDGGGFTISNLTVNRPTTEYQGLFGYLSGARIQRLRLEDVSMQGARHTGGLAGYAVGGTVEFVEITGEINGWGDTGGLIGLTTGGCAVQAVDADVSVQGDDRTGGVIGYALGNTTLYHASARGMVWGANQVGGLLGGIRQAVLADSYSRSAVNGNSHVGGAIGYMAGDSSATLARGDRIYSVGPIISGGSHGGLIGGSGHSSHNVVSDGFWDTETSGTTNSVYGSGQLTAAMQTMATYTNFNFNTLWIMAAPDTYPVLRELGAYSVPQPIPLEQLPGTGTPEDPYEIANADELNAVRLGLTNHYRLVDDIDLSDTVIWDEGRGWTPIGSDAGVLSFQGSFDGNGHTISNLSINRPNADYQGLFGYVTDADIRNLSLVSVSISGDRYVGGLAGYALSSTVEAIEVSGMIKAQGSFSGLLMGWGSNVHLHRLHADGSARGADYVGGLAGRITSVASTIYHSSARGLVEGDSHVGGLIGYLQGGLLADSYSRAAVVATSNAGGLVGVSGYTAAGSSTDAYIFRAYSDGAVTGSAGTVGGLLGSFVRGDVDDAYWDVEASGQPESTRGIGKTSLEMRQEATYRFFNFNTLWQIDEGADTPTLQDLSGYLLQAMVTLDDLEGEGTLETPYVIYSLDELAAMQFGLTNHFRLANDIEAAATVIWNGGQGWAPVGPDSGEASFQGVLDGAGYTIANLTVNRPTSNYQGLFGYLTSATVKNLRLEEAHVSGHAHVGSSAGMTASSRKEFVEASGIINGYHSQVGGLIGWISNGHIHHGQANAQVKGSSNVGGLIGRISSTASTAYHGSARGSVEGDSHVGGLIGYLQGGLLADSYSRAAIVATSNAGGLVGVSGYTAVGSSTDAYIFRAYSDGAVTGSAGTIGGLLGRFVRGNVDDAYWDAESSSQPESARGIGKTSAEMRQEATYRFFNFNTLWQIDEGADTPTFRDFSGHALQATINLDALEGEGTPEEPYLIHTLDELAAMQFGLTNHFRLANDIEAAATVIWNGGQGWAPVGPDSGEASFQGVLDGAGHTIANLTVNRPTSNYQGLFGYLTSATVENLRLSDTHVSGHSHVGALVGMTVSSQLELVETTGTVNGYHSQIGGLIGWCSNSHVYRGKAHAFVKGESNVGALIGRVSSAASSLERVSSHGTAEGTTYVGGLVGYLQGGTTADSYSRASVNGISHVGGLVGVSGYTIAGGSTDAYIHRAYSSGSVTGTAASVGGLLGTFVRGSVTASYWDQQASGQTNSARGFGRDTADMTYPRNTDTTYLDWDFLNVWSEDIADLNAGYPRLLDAAEHNLIYVAGPGGHLSGPLLQVVLAGQDGEPVEAVPDDGAEFDQWSDGRTDNPRTDTNVTANLVVTAQFKSISLVPIEWYDEHDIERGGEETWADVDQRYDPGKRMTLAQQFIADLDPNDSNSVFRILSMDLGPPVVVHFEPGSTGRVYSFQYTADPINGESWQNVSGAEPRIGQGGEDVMTDTNNVPFRLHRIQVEVP